MSNCRISALENELFQLKDDHEKLKLLHASHAAAFSKTNPSPVPPPNITSTAKVTIYFQIIMFFLMDQMLDHRIGKSTARCHLEIATTASAI